MKNSSDPQIHRQRERQFIDHIEKLLDDERLRVDTTRGRRPVTAFMSTRSRTDRGTDLKRIMSEMGRPDRELQEKMPRGEGLEAELWQKRLWFFRSVVGRVRAMSVSPTRNLLANENAEPMRKADLEQVLRQLPPSPGKAPTTLVLLCTSGFERQARELAQRAAERTLILVEPNDAGGYTVYGSTETASLNELFDPEVEQAKRQRVREAIAAQAIDLSGSGVAVERLAATTQLPVQLVEAEVKSYARENFGLAAKRLDGKLVLFRDGSSLNDASASAGGPTMPMIDRIKSLFNRRGENEKKIAFLSERRAALGQQRDRAYEEISTLEQKDTELREQFKTAGADLAKRRITSQLLQLRKDMERRQQLLGVLNQQINVVSTHLHNLELVQQGQTAKLPDSEEMASDAAAAEEMLATLQESGEMAESVGGIAGMGMSAEEQALFEELERETAAGESAATIAEPPTPQKSPATPAREPAPPAQAKSAPRRTEPEAG